MIRSGSVCLSFLYKYLMTESSEDSDGGNKIIEQGQKLKILSDVFASYGGILAKIAQIISLEDETNTVFSDCKPYCQQETIDKLGREFMSKNSFFDPVYELDLKVFKSGSIGQVHKCTLKGGAKAIIKVQYEGLRKQFETDIFLLDKITSMIFYFADFSKALGHIKTTLFDELNYKIEVENQELMCLLWKDNRQIKIPKIIKELCSDNIIGMEFIDAYGLADFIKNSTAEERNAVGNYIVDFLFTTLYKHKILYSDIHVGNFLVSKSKNLTSKNLTVTTTSIFNKDEGHTEREFPILYITDFGCLHKIEDLLIEQLKNVYQAIVDRNYDRFISIVIDMGIISQETSIESKKYCFEYFSLQYEPWTSSYFEFTEEWLTKSVYKNPELMKEWILPTNLVYFNKIPYGSYHIFTKLHLSGDLSLIHSKYIDIGNSRLL